MRWDAAFEDAQDPAFGPIAVALVLDAHDHTVAVHRLVEVVARDVDARRTVVGRRLGIDEREPAWIGRDAADHEVHPVGQAESVAANLDERAGADERTQPAPERRALLARHAQQLLQFLGRGRMVDALANQAQNLVF